MSTEARVELMADAIDPQARDDVHVDGEVPNDTSAMMTLIWQIRYYAVPAAPPARAAIYCL